MELTISRTPPRIGGRIGTAWIILSFAAILFLFPTACSSNGKVSQPDAPRRLTVLYFNDLHGHLSPFQKAHGDKETSGGVARMAALVDQIRKENAAQGVETLLVSAGDNLQGTPLSTVFEGEAEFQTLNLMKVDAAVVGNHDFDFGPENLMKLVKLAKFPVISANIYDQNGTEPLFKPYIVKSLNNGLRVSIIGLTTEETPVTTHPSNVSMLRFTNPSLALQRYIARLGQESDVLICLDHLSLREDKEIAQDHPTLTLIIGGHTHTVLEHPMTEGGVAILQAGDRGLYLGRVDLDVGVGRPKIASARLIPIVHSLPEDPETKALIDGYEARLSQEIGKRVGEVESELDGERPSVRTRETNLGDLITDIMRKAAMTDIALLNSGAIRASLLPGPVQLGAVMRVFPMNNTVVRVTLTGEQLMSVLTRSIKGLESSSPEDLFGGFLQVSGLVLEAQGGKIKSVTIKGAPLSPTSTYSVATIDFLAAGGDGYRDFKEAAGYFNTGLTLRDLFVNYLKSHPKLTAKTEGRLILKK